MFREAKDLVAIQTGILKIFSQLLALAQGARVPAGVSERSKGKHAV